MFASILQLCVLKFVAIIIIVVSYTTTHTIDNGKRAIKLSVIHGILVT